MTEPDPTTPPPLPLSARPIRYDPLPVDDTVNAPTRGNTRVALGLIGVLVALFLGGYWLLGTLGGWAATQIPVATEVAHLRPDPQHFGASPAHAAGAEGARVQRVFEQLDLSQMDPDWRFALAVLEEPLPNAFAAPGGVIIVTTGLLEATAGDDEALAFVLAHEAGHFHGRDHLEALGRRLVLGVAAALVFGDGAFGWVVDQGSDLAERGHSRGEERAADDFALTVLERSFGRIDGAERFFALLAEQDFPEVPVWLSTHPGTDERLARVRRALGRP